MLLKLKQRFKLAINRLNPKRYKTIRKIRNGTVIRYRRRKRRRKVHIQNFFNSRWKKYKYYFKKNVLNRLKETNKHKINFTKKFLINFKLQRNKVLFIPSLLSILKFLQRYVRLNFCETRLKYKIAFLPDFLLTSKPKSTRMGRGKGLVSRKIYFSKKGQIMFNFRIRIKKLRRWRRKRLLRSLLYIYLDLVLPKIQSKLTTKTIICYNIW